MRRGSGPGLLGSLLRVVAMVGVSAVLGAGYAHHRSFPWKVDKQAVLGRKLLHDELRKNNGLTHEQFDAMIQDLNVVFIDARPKDEFEAGHLFVDRPAPFIPVLNVPPEDVPNQIGRLQQLYGQQLVLYCTSLTCDLAEELVAELEKTGLGFERSNIRIYFHGWLDGIVARGLPTETGPDTWTGVEAFDPSMGLDPADPNLIMEPPGEGGAPLEGGGGG
jgi:hypothetical protein